MRAAPATAKASKKANKPAPKELIAAPAVDEDEDEDMAAPASSGSSPKAEDAAAAASGTGGASKNFRTAPDMENFYRFIYDNDLRAEALEILDQVMAAKFAKRAGGKKQLDA